MSNFGKRFQNVQSKYAKFNPIKAAIISQTEQTDRASTDGSSPRTPTKSPTELTAASFSAAFANSATEKGKIPLLLAVEAGNQSMCRELLSSQTADQLKLADPDLALE
uniref:Uncharacterized protein n=1 Tax=Anopheles maculatus TaxID=74869 RepID=A0A182SSK3_9DIPT